MLKWYVEGKSGSRVSSPRYGVSPSCSPLWRRYRHEHSTCHAGPWRRLYDDPERAWAGFIPSDRPGGRRTGPRPAGGFGRGLRPVGPVAQAQGPDGHPGGAGTTRREPRLPGGPLRPCAGPRPHGCLHRPGHAAGADRALGRDPHGLAMAGHPAAGGPGPERAGLWNQPDAAGLDGIHTRSTGLPYDHTTDGHQGPYRRAAGVTALPSYPSPGRSAGQRGD